MLPVRRTGLLLGDDARNWTLQPWSRSRRLGKGIDWIRSVALKELRKVVWDARFLKEIPYFLNFHWFLQPILLYKLPKVLEPWSWIFEYHLGFKNLFSAYCKFFCIWNTEQSMTIKDINNIRIAVSKIFCQAGLQFLLARNCRFLLITIW